VSVILSYPEGIEGRLSAFRRSPLGHRLPQDRDRWSVVLYRPTLSGHSIAARACKRGAIGSNNHGHHEPPCRCVERIPGYRVLVLNSAERAARSLPAACWFKRCGDATCAALQEEIASVTAQRNAIAGRMIAILEAAAFGHGHVDEDEARQLIDAAEHLIESVH